MFIETTYPHRCLAPEERNVISAHSAPDGEHSILVGQRTAINIAPRWGEEAVLRLKCHWDFWWTGASIRQLQFLGFNHLHLWVAGYKIHNCLYVTFKRWTTNSVRR